MPGACGCLAVSSNEPRGDRHVTTGEAEIQLLICFARYRTEFARISASYAIVASTARPLHSRERWKAF